MADGARFLMGSDNDDFAKPCDRARELVNPFGPDAVIVGDQDFGHAVVAEADRSSALD
jgi:hypothetical protein